MILELDNDLTLEENGLKILSEVRETLGLGVVTEMTSPSQADLMIEVHHDPEHAFSDGAQSLYPQQFRQLMRDIYVIAPVIGKQLDFAHLERVKVIVEGIETNPRNYTRFVVVGKEPIEDRKASKTSLICTARNEPGALFAIL